MKPLLKQ